MVDPRLKLLGVGAQLRPTLTTSWLRTKYAQKRLLALRQLTLAWRGLAPDRPGKPVTPPRAHVPDVRVHAPQQWETTRPQLIRVGCLICARRQPPNGRMRLMVQRPTHYRAQLARRSQLAGSQEGEFPGSRGSLLEDRVLIRSGAWQQQFLVSATLKSC